MTISIRTAYRVVKSHENGSDPENAIFIPQYQDEESDKWHTFEVPLRSGGHNTVYFYILSKAIDYLEHKKALEDVVVHYEDLVDHWTEGLTHKD